MPVPVVENPAEVTETAENLPAARLRMTGRWLPVAATVLFLALLAMAMLNSWNQTNSSSSIRIFDQIPLLLGGEDSPARQTADSQDATATIRPYRFVCQPAP